MSVATCAICIFQVYHPNIDLEGNVCLNILREDWKPVLNINTIIYGLYHLFTVFLYLLLTWLFSCIMVSIIGLWCKMCRSQIMRILSILMQQLCWGTTQGCLNRTWGGQYLVVLWGRHSFLAAYRVGSQQAYNITSSVQILLLVPLRSSEGCKFGRKNRVLSVVFLQQHIWCAVTKQNP